MTAPAGLIAVLTLIVSVTATLPLPEIQFRMEEPSFGLWMGVSPRVSVFRDTLSISVAGSALPGLGPIGVVHVTIPEGLELLAGDTTFTDSMHGLFPPHRLTVRALRSGMFEVRGTLRLTLMPGTEDICDVGLPIKVSGDTLRSGRLLIHWIETVRSGQRFRYDDGHVFPIDDSERFDLVEFKQHRAPARPIELMAATCTDCPVALGDSVECVVLIDRNGKLNQATVFGLVGARIPPAASIVAATRQALEKSTFRPAELHGQALSDLLWLKIPISKTR